MKKRNLLQRFIIIVAITLVGLYVVIGPHRRPKLSDFTVAGIKNTLQENIRLGLDLKGGSHLVMRVKTEEMLATMAKDNAAVAQKVAGDAGAKVSDVRSEATGGYRFSLTVDDPAKVKPVQDEVAKKVDTREWVPSVSGNTLTWTLTGRPSANSASKRRSRPTELLTSASTPSAWPSRLCNFTERKARTRFCFRCPAFKTPGALRKP